MTLFCTGTGSYCSLFVFIIKVYQANQLDHTLDLLEFSSAANNRALRLFDEEYNQTPIIVIV